MTYVLISYLFRGFRANLLFSDCKSSSFINANILLFRQSLNNCLPLRLGDAYRVLFYKTKLSVGVFFSSTNVLFEKFLDALALVTLFVLVIYSMNSKFILNQWIGVGYENILIFSLIILLVSPIILSKIFFDIMDRYKVFMNNF